MPAPHLPPDDLIGTVLNCKYQVLSRLSQGGMGVVYKARHLMLDAPVALKILLKPESEEAQQRFLSEARLASKIHHPNTVYISDFGVLDDGRAFLEMEFLDGRTLGAELRKGPMPVLRACQIAVQMARGLQAVHDKGIIHRDMKPDNVFLMEQDGSKDFVKIVDFGIAKAAPRGAAASRRPPPSRPGVEEAPADFTELGTIMGTPGYMAPEHIQGVPLSFAADQYALGCMLYEMIAGQPVFPLGDSQGLLMKHLATAPTPLRELRPAARVTKKLDALVMRLLAKEPGERLGSMREVEQALEIEIDQILIARGQRPTGTYGLVGPRQVMLLGVVVPRWALLSVAAAVLAALSYAGIRLLLKGRSDNDAVTQKSRDLLELRRQAIQILRQDVQSGPPELRDSALAALGQTGDAELRGDLLTALGSKDAQLQAQAAAALGSLGDRRAIAPLAALLPPDAQTGSGAQHVRIAAAEALRRLGEPRGTDALAEFLGSADQEAQLRAALYFCAQGPQSVQRVLGAYLQRSGLPAATTLNIMGCAAQAGNQQARERLQAQLREVGPPELRLQAAVKLAQLGEVEGLSHLRELAVKHGRDQVIAACELALLDERDGLELLRQVAANRAAPSQVRQLACDGLGVIGEPQDANRLAELFGDSMLDRGRDKRDPFLRQAAARAVVRIAGRDPGLMAMQSLSFAQAALGDSDALVRQSAAAILGDNLNAGAVSLLSGMINDADPGVRRSVVTALGRRRDAEAVAALHAGLQDPDKGVRLESLHALLRIGEALRSPALVRAAESLRAALTALLAQTPTPATLGERVLAAAVLLRMGDLQQRERLGKWLHARDAEERRLALEQLTLSADELAGLLTDKAPAVRYLAARKLGELRDRRAEPVLREILALRGADAVWAYALLQRLGAALPEADPITDLLSDREPARRVAAVEALRHRTVAQALSFLQKAEHDLERLVRWTVAEVAFELLDKPEGQRALTIIRHLANDSDPAVRARAAALLSRIPSPTASGEKKPGSPASTTKPESPEQLPQTASKDGGAAATEPLQIPSSAANSPPKTAAPGRGDGSAAQPPAPPAAPAGSPSSAQIEQLVQAGLGSFERKDFKKAQRQMAQALGLCSREHVPSGPCTAYSFDILYRLGQIHEQQNDFPEAMSAYQKVLSLSAQVHGKNDIKTAVQEAVRRLTPRLGQVVVPMRTKHGCQQESIWLRPGTHSIRVDKKFEQIEVKSREVVRVGACE